MATLWHRALQVLISVFEALTIVLVVHFKDRKSGCHLYFLDLILRNLSGKNNAYVIFRVEAFPSELRSDSDEELARMRGLEAEVDRLILDVLPLDCLIVHQVVVWRKPHCNIDENRH